MPTPETQPHDWRRWRESIGATIGEVAEAAGVHYNTVRYAETGRHKPSPVTEYALARGLRQLADRKAAA